MCNMSWQNGWPMPILRVRNRIRLLSEAVEAGRRTEAKLGLLEAKLAESQSQQLALEACTRSSREIATR